MAVQAALTGHLVLSTLHTNDAPTAVTRLLDLSVPPYLLSSTLLGVMAQRLVRTLCPHCKKPASRRRRIVALDDRAVARRQAGAGDGADRLPRVPDDGLLRAHRSLRDHDAHARAAQADHARRERSCLREQAYKDGMKPLRVSGAMKVASGHHHARRSDEGRAAGVIRRAAARPLTPARTSAPRRCCNSACPCGLGPSSNTCPW
jgi:general secretion pathway protein E